MRLEDVTMEIRPRSDWEAIDSGLAMARRDFWRCWALWWLAVLPIGLLIVLLHEHPLWWALIFFWWKLGASRMILFQISRRLFGENPSWKALWKELPRAWVRRFFYRMILVRLSPLKPLSLVVEDLENLRGPAYHNRVKMVMRRGEGACHGLTLLAFLATFGVSFALLVISTLLIPDATADAAQSDQEWEDMDFPLSAFWVFNGVFVIASSLVDVFTTGAGFGLYINSRTWVEGWDVELAFKRLANRLSGTVTLWIVVSMSLIMACHAVEPAEVEAESLIQSIKKHDDFTVRTEQYQVPKEKIEQIKNHEDFTVHRESYEVPKSSSGSRSAPMVPIGFMSVLGYICMAGVLIAIIAAIIWMISRSKFLQHRGTVTKVTEKARVVMGMEVTAESLPDDVLSVARRLWQQGQQLAAMSLLYRGSLSWWIERAGIEIHESDTEGDCLRRVRDSRHASTAYFENLTHSWVQGAYAKVLPNEAEWQTLCGAWPFDERRTA